MHSFYILMVCLLLLIPACKPVPKDSLTLLYTSDTTGADRALRLKLKPFRGACPAGKLH